MRTKRTIGIWIASIVAIVFGVLTVKSGGLVLFQDGQAREAAGNYIPFVVWFNFIAGFFYFFNGVAIIMLKERAVLLAKIIAISTIVIFIALMFYILNGGLFEQRTLVAMSIRSVLWVAIAYYLTKIKGSLLNPCS